MKTPPFKLNGIARQLAPYTESQHGDPDAKGPLLNWSCNDNDRVLIAKIVDRCAAMAKQYDTFFDPMQTLMDIVCTHCNGCELNLFAMLTTISDDDFSHDVLGLSTHIDRLTGKLKNGFTPRFVKKKHY
jgi:hypothetical protein